MTDAKKREESKAENVNFMQMRATFTWKSDVAVEQDFFVVSGIPLMYVPCLQDCRYKQK